MPLIHQAAIEPLEDRILLQQEGEQTTTEGLVLPGTAEASEYLARVVRVGPGLFMAATTVQDLLALQEMAGEPEDPDAPAPTGWWVPPSVGVERGDLVIFRPNENDPDCLDLGEGLWLVRQHHIQARVREE